MKAIYIENTLVSSHKDVHIVRYIQNDRSDGSDNFIVRVQLNTEKSNHPATKLFCVSRRLTTQADVA